MNRIVILVFLMFKAVILSFCSNAETAHDANVEPLPPEPFPIELIATLDDFTVNGDVANTDLKITVKTIDDITNGDTTVTETYKLYETTNNKVDEQISKLLMNENIEIGKFKDLSEEVIIHGNGTYLVRIEALIAGAYGLNENYHVSFYGNDIKVEPKGSLMIPQY